MIILRDVRKLIGRRRKGCKKEYQDAQANFENNPSVETRKVLEECKMDLERFFDKKTEGIIVHSRARWHEHGEKSNKYFF